MNFKCIIGFFLILNISIFAKDEYIQGKIISVSKSKQVKNDETVTKITDFIVEIMEGDQKGKILKIPQPTYKENQYNIVLKPKMNVVLYKDSDNYYIVDRDRRSSIYVLGFLFLGLTLFITRRQGFKALISLGITGFLIFKFMIPYIILGYSPILIAVIISAISSFITIFFMTGMTRKGITAILGTLGGVIFSGILSMVFSKLMGITGYTTLDSVNYASIIKNINLKELVSAGIIIGSTGAIMDVAISISSSLSEIRVHKPGISFSELFKSGMKIGNDIIGSMINTLVLAYIGSSLFTIMILTIQHNDFPSIRVFNFEFVVVEFLKAFCGSIGIVISVPLTSFLESKISSNKKKK